MRIPVSRDTYKSINTDVIEKNLESLFINILSTDIDFTIVQDEEEYTKTKIPYSFQNTDAICLFSGGIDSFSGILNTKLKYNNVVPLFK